jgi:hypothetical protein
VQCWGDVPFYAKRHVRLSTALPRPPSKLLSAPASAAANRRGLIGCIKPTANNSALVEMIRLLPCGIGVVPIFLNLSEGSREEMRSSYANYEKNIVYLASLYSARLRIRTNSAINSNGIEVRALSRARTRDIGCIKLRSQILAHPRQSIDYCLRPIEVLHPSLQAPIQWRVRR